MVHKTQPAAAFFMGGGCSLRASPDPASTLFDATQSLPDIAIIRLQSPAMSQPDPTPPSISFAEYASSDPYEPAPAWNWLRTLFALALIITGATNAISMLSAYVNTSPLGINGINLPWVIGACVLGGLRVAAGALILLGKLRLQRAIFWTLVAYFVLLSIFQAVSIFTLLLSRPSFASLGMNPLLLSLSQLGRLVEPAIYVCLATKPVMMMMFRRR
jgi:hypothetical protein